MGNPLLALGPARAEDGRSGGIPPLLALLLLLLVGLLQCSKMLGSTVLLASALREGPFELRRLRQNVTKKRAKPKMELPATTILAEGQKATRSKKYVAQSL